MNVKRHIQSLYRIVYSKQQRNKKRRSKQKSKIVCTKPTLALVLSIPTAGKEKGPSSNPEESYIQKKHAR
jgi:hypothetical protein